MYFVSRQRYWPDGNLMVEVSCGGLNYAGADMLGVKFGALGEGQEYKDPREAVEAAIKVRDAWANWLAEKDPKQASYTSDRPGLGYGNTMGMTMPFSECTDKQAREWAEKVYDSLQKCAQCGEVIGKKFYRHEFCDDDKFCSENCAEDSYNELFSGADSDPDNLDASQY